MRDGQTVVEALGKEGVACNNNQKVLYEYRATAFFVKTASGPFLTSDFRYEDSRKLATEDPLGHLAYSQVVSIGNMMHHAESPWLSDFQHRALNLVAICVSIHHAVDIATQAALRDQVNYLSYNLNQLLDLSRTRIARSQPTVAKSIVEVWLPSLLETVGITIDTLENSVAPWNQFEGGGRTLPGDFDISVNTPCI